jgi:predicted metalloprotease
MRFSNDSQLDTSQVSDQRGMGGGIGRSPVLLGGGGVSIVGIVLYLAVTLLGGGQGGTGNQVALNRGAGADLGASCHTGADANQSGDCRMVAVVNSVQSYWTTGLNGYHKAPTVLFTDQTNTGCGAATADVGPFYCPPDETVYIDLNFFAVLQSEFGAQGGPFAEAYVIGHEYGHHVQHITGDDQKVGRDRQGPESGSVRLELQADCLAGVWASHAQQTGFIAELTDEDIKSGLDAAAAIGDDRIQQTATGRVSPERFTHGTSAQRQSWFLAGFRSGDRGQCDTFSAATL